MRLDVDIISARGLNGWYRPASTKIDKNDGVTSAPPTTHVRCTLDHESFTTVSVTESDKPKYTNRFNFTVNPTTQQWSEVLFEVLEDEKKSAQPLVGAMSIPMHTVFSQKSSGEEWYPIIDHRTGLVFGELKVKFALTSAKVPELPKVTRTGKRFAEYFGLTDYSDPLEFPYASPLPSSSAFGVCVV